MVKNMKNIKKNIAILTIASLTIIMFIGCSSYKKIGYSQNSGTTNNTDTGMAGNTGTENEQISYQTSTQLIYSNALKPLVTKGTITQKQSDKVLAAITRYMPNDTGTARTPSTSSTPGTPSTSTPGTGTPITDTSNVKMIPNISELNVLVKSGVITQVQANVINQKIQEVMISNPNNQIE